MRTWGWTTCGRGTLNVGTGRFYGRDTYMGSVKEPISLHKYDYAQSSPTNGTDPTGRFTLVEAVTTTAISSILTTQQFAYGELIFAKAGYALANNYYYGNWCGPGWGGSTYNVPEAVDDFDRACMWHDLGYARCHHFGDVATDRILIANIDAVLADQYDDVPNFNRFLGTQWGSNDPQDHYQSQGVTPLGRLTAIRVKQAIEFGLRARVMTQRRGITGVATVCGEAKPTWHGRGGTDVPISPPGAEWAGHMPKVFP